MNLTGVHWEHLIVNRVQAPGPRTCGISDTKDVKENPSEDQRSVFVHEKGPEIISLMLAVSRSKWLSTIIQVFGRLMQVDCKCKACKISRVSSRLV